MSEFAFQLDNEQKWVGQEEHYFQKEIIKTFQDVVDKVLKASDIPENVREHLTRSRQEVQEQTNDFLNLKHYVNFSDNNSYYSRYFILTTKAATRLNMAFISGTEDLQEIINKQKKALDILLEVKKIIAIHLPLFQVKLGANEIKGYNSSFSQLKNFSNSQNITVSLKALEKLEKKLKSGEIKSSERNTENMFIRKTAWAIFEKGRDDHSGFKGKNGELGDISIARLFDSDKGANRTARAMSLTSYDIVEVDVSLRKRMNVNPDFADKNLDAALVILEKEKIEQFFKEIPLQDIENRLEEEKTKKRNKI